MGKDHWPGTADQISGHGALCSRWQPTTWYGCGACSLRYPARRERCRLSFIISSIPPMQNKGGNHHAQALSLPTSHPIYCPSQSITPILFSLKWFFNGLLRKPALRMSPGQQQIPLTDVKIRNAKAGAKPVRLFDGGGMYLEVSLPAASCGA